MDSARGIPIDSSFLALPPRAWTAAAGQGPTPCRGGTRPRHGSKRDSLAPPRYSINVAGGARKAPSCPFKQATRATSLRVREMCHRLGERLQRRLASTCSKPPAGTLGARTETHPITRARFSTHRRRGGVSIGPDLVRPVVPLGRFPLPRRPDGQLTTRMCNSRNWRSSTGDGAPSIKSAARCVFGNAMTSRMLW